MLAILFAAIAVASAAPSPVHYYAQALATMQRLPEPAYISFDTNVTARGMGIEQPCHQGKILWSLGWGKQMQHQLAWHATYVSATGDEMIRTREERCSGPAGPFDRPTWNDVYEWIRYGIFGTAPTQARAPAVSPPAATGLKTISSVSAIAPGAYRVEDGGAQRCPSGSTGHLLHFTPRFERAKHPLRDAVIETQTMRICMIRFDLGSYQAAGSGFRGDMRLDFGDIDGNWIITGGHAAMALRAIGISAKTVTFDFSLVNVAFPPTAASR